MDVARRLEGLDLAFLADEVPELDLASAETASLALEIDRHQIPLNDVVPGFLRRSFNPDLAPTYPTGYKVSTEFDPKLTLLRYSLGGSMTSVAMRPKTMAKKRATGDDVANGGEGKDGGDVSVKIFLSPATFEEVRAAAEKRCLPVASFVRMAAVKEAERVKQGRD
ncbi:hypothetical protein [Singulisphaera sp. PoT]|uniref:hypothetical protein n=1 Tax=Singulisphaera sp. PoT TaxID=3411797 RepID=UPI003BF561C6